MAELANRDDYEGRLQRALGKVGSAAIRRILDALGSPPDIANVPGELMQEIEREYGVALASVLESVFIDSAEAAAAEAGIGFSWDVINREAADWARQHATGLAHDLGVNSDRFLREALGDFFEQRIDNRTLTERIARIYGPKRAETVTITEITRASAQGQQAAIREIEASVREAGLRPVLYWNSANDSLVCPICGPRHGKRQGDGWTELPPAHARCRCGIRVEWEAIEP